MSIRATVLNASAGSGKTYKLAYRYVRDLIKTPKLYRNILAVTFTNKATEEMKSRILSQINILASSAEDSPYIGDLKRELSLHSAEICSRAKIARSYILHDYSRFTILTIDRFFQRIIRAFIQELGIDISYNIEIESADILTQSADKLIDSISEDEELREWLLGFAAERIDNKTKWDIRGALIQTGGEIFKESIAKRLDNCKSREQLKDIVNRYKTSEKESKTRFITLAKSAETIMHNNALTGESFSGASRSFALYFHKVSKGDISAPTATARKRALSIEGWCRKGEQISDSIVESLRDILEQMCALYDNDIKLWNTATLLSENYRSAALLSDLYLRLQELSKEQNILLLAQSKSLLTDFIAGNDAPFIYEKIGNYYERFLLDEFQDTSSMEWDNLRPLLANATSQSEDSSVLIVGDIKQSIYRWRGGDWRILHSGVSKELGEDCTEVINLQDNWRSGSSIVEFVNEAIDYVTCSYNDILNTILQEAKESSYIDSTLYHALYNTTRDAYSSHAQTPRRKESGYVQLCEYAEESPYLDSIKEALEAGYKPCEIMILTRTRSEGVKVAEDLLLFKKQNCEAIYDFDIMTQEALLIGSSEVCRFIISLFTLSIDSKNRVERAIYNRFIGEANANTPISDERIAFLTKLRQHPIIEAFDMVIVEFELWKHTSQIAFIQALHEQIISYVSSKSKDLSIFVKWWMEHGATKSLSVEQSERTIEITTIHKAKGLEKRVVIIPYCSWDVEPKSSGVGGSFIWSSSEEIGEFPLRTKSIIAESHMASEYYRERIYSHIDAINLLYVALTRAEDALYIFTKRDDKRVGGMLLSSISHIKERVAAPYQTYQTEDNIYHLFAEKGHSSRNRDSAEKSSVEVIKIDNYPTRISELDIKLPMERYREDAQREFSARDIGILMHSLFEGATSWHQVVDSLEQMRESDKIEAEECQEILCKVEQAQTNPTINEWFTESAWDKILCERAIIIPSQTNIRRPDRVMIRGERAVVVDYKFGELNPRGNYYQVRRYMELLRQMGYSQVEGWLWRVKSGLIEAV